jgi:serine/threonine protein phosphatase PrpC
MTAVSVWCFPFRTHTSLLTDLATGTLAVSRSLGDHAYKLHPSMQPSPAYVAALRPGTTPPSPSSTPPGTADLVSGIPHMTSFPLGSSSSAPFLVLGSDGLFGALRDEEVVDAVTRLRGARWPAKAIAQHLVEVAVTRAGNNADNVTAVVVLFG